MRPRDLNQQEFQRLLKLLPAEALDQLEAAAAEMDRTGAQVDLVAATKALLSHSMRKIAEAMPAMPPHLAPYADPEISGGREYELVIDRDPHDQPAMTRAREQFIEEARRVRDMVQDGMDVEDAWRRASRRSLHDDLIPVRRHRERIANRRRTR
ncbi:MAG: hypothetical protein EOS25_13930 [Mesorhizobium sp.]|uniref:hypothetical protein n=1 Tax=Mesorhizobium sp. TaxID=1871066 RepID=UPI000FE4EF15|nr:hypothetical protein [Mesorhizobium sp.]RWD51232.1 MAG: hypothetical protein EOS59_06495 [Mesorhizobium sp.]RWE60076.1 MAG: hypothetical protein EOS24_13290 [Mesorhizobium sp.]RWF11531.1 MAG: hypothetical protein EOS69_08810 [Mesorhizobium sp.]RWF18429.1 MAG: hypothetical protein EOS25_13930 [Mesorhizobium sp.]